VNTFNSAKTTKF